MSKTLEPVEKERKSIDVGDSHHSRFSGNVSMVTVKGYNPTQWGFCGCVTGCLTMDEKGAQPGVSFAFVGVRALCNCGHELGFEVRVWMTRVMSCSLGQFQSTLQHLIRIISSYLPDREPVFMPR
jgi:hypothetical protein